MSRPDRCAAVIKRMIASGISTPGVLVVNGTDCEREYRDIRLPSGWQIQVLQENIGHCPALAKIFREFPNEPWYGIVTDNEYVYTQGFDQILIRAAGNYGISHGDDGVPNKPITIHTYAVYGGELLRAIGYWPIPGVFHAFTDWAWQLIGQEFNLIVPCPNVITEHKEIAYGRDIADKPHQISQSHALNDQRIWLEWKKNDWPALRERLAPLFSRID